MELNEISIKEPTAQEVPALSLLAQQTFWQSHGHSATKEVVAAYVAENFSEEALHKELEQAESIFQVICCNGLPAGYSKIVLNAPLAAVPLPNITKLERIYLLQEFYHLKLGWQLLQHNVAIARERLQAGMWLNVWIENERAFRFYRRAGFEVVGRYDFRLSENHSNPNYQMYLPF